ncbi:hypothetical protein QQP08_017300 [Theobroma cacao]|nr:hypothetical protein QQP08_017300 [Theobroma cacao]
MPLPVISEKRFKASGTSLSLQRLSMIVLYITMSIRQLFCSIFLSNLLAALVYPALQRPLIIPFLTMSSNNTTASAILPSIHNPLARVVNVTVVG